MPAPLPPYCRSYRISLTLLPSTLFTPRLFPFSWEKSLFIVIFAVITSFVSCLFSGSWSSHFWFLFWIFLLLYIYIFAVRKWDSSFSLFICSHNRSCIYQPSSFFLFPHLPTNDRGSGHLILSLLVSPSQGHCLPIPYHLLLLTDDPGLAGPFCVPVFVNWTACPYTLSLSYLSGLPQVYARVAAHLLL